MTAYQPDKPSKPIDHSSIKATEPTEITTASTFQQSHPRKAIFISSTPSQQIIGSPLSQSNIYCDEGLQQILKTQPPKSENMKRIIGLIKSEPKTYSRDSYYLTDQQKKAIDDYYKFHTQCQVNKPPNAIESQTNLVRPINPSQQRDILSSSAQQDKSNSPTKSEILQKLFWQETRDNSVIFLGKKSDLEKTNYEKFKSVFSRCASSLRSCNTLIKCSNNNSRKNEEYVFVMVDRYFFITCQAQELEDCKQQMQTKTPSKETTPSNDFQLLDLANIANSEEVKQFEISDSANLEKLTKKLQNKICMISKKIYTTPDPVTTPTISCTLGRIISSSVPVK